MAVSAIAGLASIGSAMIAAGKLAIGWAAALKAFAIGASLSAVSRALAPQPSLGAQLRGITQTTRNPAGPRKLVYGQMRVGGQVVFIGHSGADNKYLHLVLVFATHEIESYEEFWFNDKKVYDNGAVLSDWSDVVTITKFDGSQTTAASSLTSAFATWTSNHILNGMAYAHLRLEWDADKFPQGVPNISAVIKGKKVYDPRDTNQSATNASTWTYSQNPALCLRDYLVDNKYGLGEDHALIDTTALTAAANLCEESISLDGGGTQDRYKLNGVIDTANQIKDNIEQMLSAMGGRISYSGGKYFITGAEYNAPTLSFDEADCVAEIQLQTKQSRRSAYNGVKGIFVSEEKNYKVLDYPAQISSTYATEDGDPIYLDMALPFVTNNVQAQRIAKIALLKSRQQTIIGMTVNLKGLRVKVGDTINVSNTHLGYSNKVFEIVDYSLAIADGGNLAVNLTCIETASAVYDWTTSDQEDFLSGGELTLYDGRTVDNVTSLTATEIGLRGPDGALKSSVQLAWTAPTDAFIEFYTVRYNKNGTTEYFEIQTRETNALLEGLDITSNYDFRVKAQNLIGVQSTGTSITNRALNGDTTAPSAPTSVTLTAGINQITCEWTNPTDIDLAFVEVHVTTTSATPSVSASPTAKVGGEEYIATGLSEATRYFHLRAVDFSGNKSGYTTQVSATSLLATGADIATGAVDTDEIATGAVTEVKIEDGAVTADKITVNELSAISADVGSITAGTLQAGGSNAIPDANDSPSGSETGAFIDLDNGKFVFGDANKHLLYDGSTLLVKGELEADILDVIDATITGQLTANAISAGAVTVASLSAGVFAEFDDRYGTSGGFYVTDTDEFFDGNSTKYVTVGTVAHSTDDIYFECRLNHSWSYNRNDTGDKLKANVSFEYSTDNSTWTTVPSSTTQVATATGVVAQYATLYSIAEDITYTMTGSALTAGNYYFRVKIVAQNSTNAFQLAALGSGSGVPIAFEVQESSGISAAGGNADTLDGLDSTQFLRSDTNDTFNGDLTITGQLILNGSIDQYNVTDLNVTDKTITVNSGNTQSLSDGAGLIVDRGTAADASITWDETNDEFDFSHALNVTGSVTWTGGSSTNANTAYTYSQVGHLPLTGGTVTGAVTVQDNVTADSADIGEIFIGKGSATSGQNERTIGSTGSYLLIQRDGLVPIELWGSKVESRSTHYFGTTAGGKYINTSGDAVLNDVTTADFDSVGTANFGNSGSGAYKLNIHTTGNQDALAIYATSTSGTTDQSAIRFFKDGGLSAHIGLAVDAGRLLPNTAANDFAIKTSGSLHLGNGNGTNLFTFTNTGNIKVGTQTIVTSNRELTNIASIDMPTSGSQIMVNAYSTTSQEGGGIFFRDGFDSSSKYNLSIMARSRADDGSTDGLSINGYEGIAFSTGSNSYNERLFIDASGNFDFNDGSISNAGSITSEGSITAGNGSTSLGYYVGPNQVINGSRVATFAQVVSSGSLSGTGVHFSNTHSKTKIRLLGSTDDAHNIGTESYNNTYGPNSWTGGTIGHKFYGTPTSLIARLGTGGASGDLNSEFYGSVKIDQTSSSLIDHLVLENDNAAGAGGAIAFKQLGNTKAKLKSYFGSNQWTFAIDTEDTTDAFEIYDNGFVNVSGALGSGGITVLSSSRRFYASDGTSVKAAYSFDGDSGTGISHTATGRIDFLSSGAIKAYIKTGTSNPISPTMYVDGRTEINGVVTWTGGSSTNANTAYSWGDHSTQGYLTSSSAIAATQLTGTIDNNRLSSDVLITDGGTYSTGFSSDLDTITGFRIHRVTGFTGTDHRAFTGHHNLLQLPNTSSSGPYEVQLAFTTVSSGTPEFKFRSSGVTWSDWVKVFNDGYHPNADKWTTARTLSLTGAVTGSVSWDGSGNASLATSVGNLGNTTVTDLTVDGPTNASIRIDRASASNHNNLLYYTNGSLTWRIWQSGADNTLAIRNEAATTNVMTMTNTDTVFANNVTANGSFVTSTASTAVGIYAGSIQILEGSTRLLKNVNANASILTSGTLPSARLSGTYSEALNFSSSALQLKGHMFFNEYTAGRHYIHFKTAGSTNRIDWRIQTNSANNTIHSWTESTATFRTKMHINTGSGGNSVPTNYNLLVEDNANAVIALSVPETGAGGLFFPRGTTAYYSGIERANTTLHIKHADASALSFDSNRDATFSGYVKTTNLFIGATSSDLINIHTDSTNGQIATYRNNTGYFIHRTYADYGNDGTEVELQQRVGADGNYSSIGNFSAHDFHLRTNNTNRISIASAGNVSISNALSIVSGIDSNTGGAGTNLFRTNTSDGRVLRLRDRNGDSGNIIQFEQNNGSGIWEVVGRSTTFYVYKNGGTGSGYKWQIDTNGSHTFTGGVTFSNGVLFNNEVTLGTNNSTTNAGRLRLEGAFANTGASSHPRITFNDDNFGIGVGGWATTGNNDDLYLWAYNGAGRKIRFATTSAGSQGVASSSWLTNATIDNDGNFDLARGALEIGGTTVIDSDRHIDSVKSLVLENVVQSSTTNRLYQNQGTLYWDGAAVATSGGNGVVRVNDGDASAPSFSFTNDTDTGMYSDIADGIRWAVGGSAKMSLVSTGLGVTGTVGASAGFKLGLTQWMDSSRNMSSIGTISSGGITTSGNLVLDSSGYNYIELHSSATNTRKWRFYNGQHWNQDALLIYDQDADSTVLTLETGKLGVNRGANSLSHNLDVGGTVAISGVQIIDGSRNITAGTITTSGGGGSTSPVLGITSTNSSSFIHASNAFAANMTAGQFHGHFVGKAGSTKNAGGLGYYWAASGSDSNFVSFGHWGADHLLRLYGNGNLNIHSGALQLGGTTVINSARSINNVTLGALATGARFETNNWHQDSGGQQRFYFEGSGRTFIKSGSNVVIRNSSDSGVAAFDSSGNLRISTNSDQTAIGYGLQVGNNTFTGGNGVYANSRLGIMLNGSLKSYVYASTYNDASYPDYGFVFIHGGSTSSYNVWSISPDGPAKGNALNFIYGSNATNIHTATPKVIFDGNGDVGIGVTPNGSYRLYVGGHIAQSSGSIYSYGDVVIGQGGLKRGSTDLITSSLQLKNITKATIGAPLSGTFPDTNAQLDVASTTAQTNFSSNALTYGSDRASIVVDARHSSTKDGTLGYAGPMMDFRSHNASYQWSVAQIIGTVDPEGGSVFQGGLVFSTSGGGTTNPTGRRDQGAAPTARMLIGAGGNVTILTGDLKFGTSPTSVITSAREIRNVANANIASLRIGHSSSGTTGAYLHNIESTGSYLLLQRNQAAPIEIWGSRAELRTATYFGSSSDAHGYVDTSGNATFEGNVTAYGSPSDIRLKENVQRIADPIDKVKQLDGVTFDYKKDGSRSTGLIAQQLLDVLPEVVYETKDLATGEEHYAVRYGNVVGLLVEAMKEQQETIESLTKRIEELENGDN